jgi:uncharacterized MnhB-related membrane protein
MEAIARNPTNMNVNVLLLMAIMGAIAAIATNHFRNAIVIEPIVELFKHYIFIKRV